MERPRRLHKVDDFMMRDLVLHTVGYRTIIRPEGYRRDLLAMLAPFPAGRFEVRDVQTNYAERYAGLRIAVMLDAARAPTTACRTSGR